MDMKLRKVILLLALLLIGAYAAQAQKVALKTNALHWAAMGSPNGSLEVAIGPRWTMDLYGGGNLWKFDKPLEVRHWLVQPEVRYWLCEAFNGTFIGLHGHYGQYNVGGFDIPVGRLKAFKDHRYEGYFYGAGLSLGHQWVLSDHLNLETSLGGGWARTPYRKHACAECAPLLEEKTYDYFGVTRAMISLTYFLD